MKIADRLFSLLPEALRSSFEHVFPPLKYINFCLEIERSDHTPWDLKQQNQLIRFKRIALHAQRYVPYYRSLFRQINFDAGTIRSLSDLGKIPILQRETVQRHPELFLTDGVKREKLTARSTSGSTGTPLNVYFSAGEIAAQGALVRRQYRLAGVDPRDPHIVIAKALKRTLLMERRRGCLYFNTLRFDTRSVQEIAHFLLEQKRYGFVRGMPSFLKLIALELRARKARLSSLRAVITGYEYLSQNDRRSLSETFGCPVFNFYGMNEATVWGVDCPFHEGFHIDSNSSIVELLPVEGPETSQVKLITTTLINQTMPLIRYDTGDIASLSQKPCPCGRTDTLVENITGRSGALIRLEDGSTYDFRVLSWVLRNLKGIKESRYVYYPRKEIVLEIVSGGAVDMSRLQKRLSGLFANRVKWSIRMVEGIARKEKGKFNFVHIVDSSI
ncbi:MAG: AMP-binding protein [Candidatus Omnitrophota bacterium]